MISDPVLVCESEKVIGKIIIDKTSPVDDVSEENGVSVRYDSYEHSISVEFTESRPEMSYISVYDVNGRSVYSSNIQRNSKYFKFDVYTYRPGIYYLNVFEGNDKQLIHYTFVKI